MSLMAMPDGTLRCVLPLLGICKTCFAHAMLVTSLSRTLSWLCNCNALGCGFGHVLSTLLPMRCLHDECGPFKAETRAY